MVRVTIGDGMENVVWEWRMGCRNPYLVLFHDPGIVCLTERAQTLLEVSLGHLRRHTYIHKAHHSVVMAINN